MTCRSSGELVERSFAHCYETGGMRRTHLRGRENILKRQLIHVCAFNLSLIFRQMLGAGTPRELRNRQAALISAFMQLQAALSVLLALSPTLDETQFGSTGSIRATGASGQRC